MSDKNDEKNLQQEKLNLEELEEDLNFEEAIEKLEKIVEDLESGGLNLEKSLNKFTRGVKLINYCNQELDRAEKKIEQVVKEGEEFGEVVPFESEEE